MKKKSTLSTLISRSFLFLLLCIVSVQCGKKDNDLTPDEWLDHSYAGSLSVHFTLDYPEVNASTDMDVLIDKETGGLQISSGSLSFEGETIIDEDAKITRSGTWSFYPTGYLINPDDPCVFIDGALVIDNDVQKIYAKDDNGVWQLVSTINNAPAEPNADLTFNLDEAVISGATVSIAGSPFSWLWTLDLNVVD